MASVAGPATSGGRSRSAAIAVAVAVGVVAASVGGYLALRTGTEPGSSRYGPTEIDLLPSERTRSGCIVGTPGVPRPIAALQYGVMQANTYSVPSGTTGHVGMCYNASSGAMFAYANWSHVGTAGGWFSYPQVAYGVDIYAGEATVYTNQSPAWALPQTVASTVNEDLWVTASYRLNPPNASDVSGYDLSFDDFFSEGLPPTLEVPPFVEVEIFLAHNISYPSDWVHWSALTLVNDSLETEPWDVGYWCHGTDNGTNGNVSFDFSYDGQATRGLVAGTLGVNLSAMLAEVEALLPGAACWTGPTHGFGGFYLGEEDLGSEDGAVGGASYNYNWTVTQYCLHTQVDPTDAAAASCLPADPPERPSGEVVTIAGASALGAGPAVSARTRDP
jgi:hypothetical protein